MKDNSAGTALITGGAGFLGSHLCDRLIGEGIRVLCVDNLLTGSIDNVRHLIDHPRFSLLHHDVNTPIFVDELFADGVHRNVPENIDFVLHFASPASPKDYARFPIPTLKVGALGTFHALGLAKAYDATFVLASSSEVYGDPLVSPQGEDYYGNVNPIGPRSVYDEAKRYAEALTSAYFHAHGMDVRIARLFNTYGPRMRINDGRAVPAFLSKALRLEPITVYGDGSQTRSFCYVDDTIEAIYRMMTLPRQADNQEHPTLMNIGNPDEVTILQVAQEIVELTRSRSQIVFEPMPQNDPMQRKPDITRAKTLLGWEPKVQRLAGFERTIPYFITSLELSRL